MLLYYLLVFFFIDIFCSYAFLAGLYGIEFLTPSFVIYISKHYHHHHMLGQLAGDEEHVSGWDLVYDNRSLLILIFALYHF
jgi:hypothetical protein